MAMPTLFATIQLFIMRRFDILESGDMLGMEDFSVLMGRPGDKKYLGR